MKRYLKAISFSSVFLFAPLASASPEFPTVVMEELELGCTPACTLCHSTDPGVLGSAFSSEPKAFVGWLARSGLASGNEDSLRQALAELQAEPTPRDSDMDGVSDLDELSGEGSGLASDPSDPESVPGSGAVICDIVVGYGCGATVAPPSRKLPHASWWALGALTLGLAGVWRSRARKAAK